MPLSESAADTYELIFARLSDLPTEKQELFMARLLLLCTSKLPKETLDELLQTAAQIEPDVNSEI